MGLFENSQLIGVFFVILRTFICKQCNKHADVISNIFLKDLTRLSRTILGWYCYSFRFPALYFTCERSLKLAWVNLDLVTVMVVSSYSTRPSHQFLLLILLFEVNHGTINIPAFPLLIGLLDALAKLCKDMWIILVSFQLCKIWLVLGICFLFMGAVCWCEGAFLLPSSSLFGKRGMIGYSWSVEFDDLLLVVGLSLMKWALGYGVCQC